MSSPTTPVAFMLLLTGQSLASSRVACALTKFTGLEVVECRAFFGGKISNLLSNYLNS